MALPPDERTEGPEEAGEVIDVKGQPRENQSKRRVAAPVRRVVGLAAAAVMAAALAATALAASPAPNTAEPSRPVIVPVATPVSTPVVVDPVEQAKELAPGGASPIALPK